MSQPEISIVILISGSGSNLQAIIDATQSGTIPARIEAVICNKEDAFGLTRAANAGLVTEVISHKNYDSREHFDQALKKVIDQYSPDLVVLAGFMRILTPEFVKHYSGRMLNIHPSLLPKYRGLNTHQRAIEAGESEHGVTVHFVTEELDGGPNVLQARVPISTDESTESLAKKVLRQEHQIYPRAVKWFAQGRLKMNNNQAMLDEKTLPECGEQHQDGACD
ncbi:phosphoribosylglycinamide formyltransferase [Alkalimarinus alittae]|uniref:Phosphoribosylglycinamide formyltransferase n=1 Tax=Alkalimarinus alittae TaxID=2961619 RepID=A0ABY6MYY1_9ALTE|nr:phosphoribosylglycinamide formyltransferase [Alkalimarinus alittae]UZE95005.1 phosphoribosylglycinamide formyltransferase [Alkalimarinus alittae]